MLTHAAFSVLCLAALPAEAQTRAEPNVKLIDCDALKAVIADAPTGFAASRGASSGPGDIVTHEVAQPLVGACRIIEKTKVGETAYACESPAEIRDFKASVETCLGASARGNAMNEAEKTNLLRYDLSSPATHLRLVVQSFSGVRHFNLIKVK